MFYVITTIDFCVIVNYLFKNFISKFIVKKRPSGSVDEDRKTYVYCMTYLYVFVSFILKFVHVNVKNVLTHVNLFTNFYNLMLHSIN